MKRVSLTWVLLGSLAITFAVELASGALGNDGELLAMGALRDAGFEADDWWRLVTYAWLHASWTHFLLNAGLLYWVGHIVERRAGPRALATVYGAGALVGGLAIAARSILDPRSGVSLGASAAIYAVLVCAIFLLYRDTTAHTGPSRVVRDVLIVIAVAGIAASFMQGVSLVGHAAGLAVGIVAGFLVRGRGTDG